MTNQQLEMAIGDLREQLNEVYNEHAEMREHVKELRILAGLESPQTVASGQEIDTHAHNTCGRA